MNTNETVMMSKTVLTSVSTGLRACSVHHADSLMFCRFSECQLSQSAVAYVLTVPYNVHIFADYERYYRPISAVIRLCQQGCSGAGTALR